MDRSFSISVLSVLHILFFISVSYLSTGLVPVYAKNSESASTLKDTDKDGLSDSYEEKIGTEPFLSDTDGDGLSDGVEVGKNLEKPLNHDDDKRIDALDLDDDNDGLPTILEVMLGADIDTDNDGIKNYLDSDSDNDGVDDGIEAGKLGKDTNFDRIDDAFDSQSKGKDQQSIEDKNGDGIADTIVMPDHNKDGVPDMLDKNFKYGMSKKGHEKVRKVRVSKAEASKKTHPALKTEALVKDSSVKEKVASKSTEESEHKTLPKKLASESKLKNKTKPISKKKIDSDNDGLLDSQEIAFGTNPKKRDSDDDKVSDAIEIGIDPKVAQDSDHDGKIDALDSDDDNDGILTRNEDINKDGSPVNDDTDEDGVPNYLDANDDGDSLLTITEGGRLDSDKDGILDYLDNNDAVKYKRAQEVVVLHDSDQTEFDSNTISAKQVPEANIADINDKAEATKSQQQNNRVTQALEQAIAHNQKNMKAQKFKYSDNAPEGKLAKKKQVALRKTEKGFIPWLTSLLPD